MADKTNLHLNRCVARVCYKSARQLHIDNMCVATMASATTAVVFQIHTGEIGPIYHQCQAGAERRDVAAFACVKLYVVSSPNTSAWQCVRVCDHVTRCRDGDWWYAEHLSNGRRGYIPVNYIAEVNSIRRFECVNILRHYNHNYAPTLCRISCRNS